MGTSGSEFRYIINAQLKLNTGSLKTVIAQISEMDKGIRDHFGKTNGGVKVPLIADKDISRLQKSSSEIIDRYNKGQVPTIKVPVVVDENSINKLQARIANVKKQLNSLSDEKSNVNVNTSLVVGKNAGDEIQRQVREITPTIEVKVIANEDSLKDVKAQIEAVKADIQANVNTVQSAPPNMRRLGAHHHHPTNSVGNTANGVRGAIRNPRINPNLENQRKALQNDINTTQGIIKSLQDEMKLELSVSQIEKRIQSIREAREKGTPKVQVRNAKGKFSGSINADQYDNEIKSLEDALKKHEQVEKLQKELNDKEDRLSKIQQQGTQRRFTLNRPQTRVTSWYDDIPLPTPRVVVQQNRIQEIRKLKEQQKQEEKARQQIKAQQEKELKEKQKQEEKVRQQMSGYVPNVPKAEELAWEQYNSVGRITDIIKAKTMANSEKKYKNQKIMYPQNAWKPAWDEYYARKGWETDPNKAYAQADRTNKNIKREQQTRNKEAERIRSVNQTNSDYANHIRRFGPHNQYSAESMVDALRDPNVSLADSKKILGQLNQQQAMTARNNKMNFQKSYSMRWLDDKGQLQEANTMVYQYTKLGEVIEKADKGFLGMMEHITSKVGVFSALEGGIILVVDALTNSITEMVQFNQQLAEIQSTTQNLNNTNLKQFYTPAGGSAQLQSQIQDNAFSIGKQFGVDTLNTVMPIEQSVIARPDLISGGANGNYDSGKQNEITKKIMQFSAISTGGKEDEQTVNELTNDILSLYQANQTVNPKGYMSDMTNMLDYMSAMHSYGVHTTNVTNAMAELAPESLQLGINNNQAMALMGTFDLANAGGKPEDTENVGKTFYNSIMHANTNTNLKDSLDEYLGIDLNASPMNAPNLINTIIAKLPSLKGNDRAMMAVATALSSTGSGSQTKAMTPLMTKFLEGSQTSTFQNFMGMSGDKSKGAMDNAWGPFSKTLVININSLVQSFKQLAQLIGQLGFADSLGAMLKVFTSILNIVDSVLQGMQKLSAFFQDKGMFDFSKFTASALGFLGTLKLIQKFFNAKQWGGYVGSAISRTNPWGYSLGIKQNPAIGGVTTASTASTVVKEAESIAPAVLPFAPVSAQNTASKINPQEMSQLERTMASKNVNSVLNDVMTFSTADMMVNDFKANPATSRLISNVNKTVVPQSLSGMNIVSGIPTPSSALEQNVARTEAMGTTRSALSSVGNFIGEASFVGAIGNGGLARGSSTFFSGLINGFKGLLPMLTEFGFLMTRLTVIGGTLFLAFEGVKLVAEQIAKDKANQNHQTQSNINTLHSQIKNNPKIANNILNDVTNLQKYKQSPQSTIAESPVQKKYGVNSPEQNKGEANIQNLAQYGIQYHKTLNGKDYLTYQTGVDKSGNAQTSTYHIGNTGEQKKFDDFINNGMVTDTKQLADQWAINTNYLTGYTNQLKVVNTLTQNLTENMRSVDSATKAVDATFGGTNSASSLAQKISITKDGLNKASSQYDQVYNTMDQMGANKDKANNQYNNAKTKVLDSGVSQSDITKMETDMLVSRSNGQDSQTTIDNYKNDPKMYSLAQAFNTLQDFTTTFNSTSDNFLSLKDQISSMNESLKQWQSQMNVAKLGLDALNGSLSALSNVANASNALVNINANPINNGHNDSQINAMSGAMGATGVQLANMQLQKSRIQQEMSNLVSSNPGQDFSLNALYNPNGGVTAQQLEYKSLYETNTQITDSITNQTNSMYSQVTQLRDLVLNSSKYADVWQRIQDNVQLVKDSIKQTGDYNAQIANLNSNSLAQSVTGTDPWSYKKQQLQNMSSSEISMASQLQNALYSSNGDSKKLAQAMADIQKTQGSEFEQTIVNPLKDVVSGQTNSFLSAGDSLNQSAKSIATSVGTFGSAVSDFMNLATNPPNSNSTGGGGVGAQTIGGFKYTAPSNTGNNLTSTVPTTATMIPDSTSSSTSAQDITKVNLTSGPVVDAINKVFSGTQMAGYGADYVDLGSQYGIDPRLMAAITMAETGGNSNALNTLNNVGGIMDPATGNLQSFTSVYNSAQDLASILKNYYFDEGKNTIPTIQEKYAPYNASNDPNHLNDHWRNNVSSYYSQMTGIPQSQLLGSTPVQSSPTATYSTSSSSAGGVNAMFGWYNSVLDNTSKMQYVWGGAHQSNEDWNTFIKQAEADCSGLVNQVYKQFMGINLGNPATTTSESMWNNSQGTKVAKGNLQQGDLVFFGSGGDASHVGVYAGNNQMYTIDHSGMPVTKENLWSDYMGGKHYNSPSGSQPISSSIVQQAQQTQQDTFVQAITKFINAYNDASASLNPTDTINSQNYQLKNNLATAYGNGNIADVLGTSGILNSFDVIQQSRQGLYSQEIQNKNQIDFQNAQRNQVIGEMQKATNSGDASSYNEYHAQLASIDKYIGALENNTKALQGLDAQYKAQQQLDPRYNYSTASGDIQGGIATLKLQDAGGQSNSPDYLRVVNEVNTMLSTYDTHIKQTQALQTLWNQTGQQTDVFASAKRTSDQDNINLIYTQLDNINQILNKFAQGTQAWYSSLETVVATEQALQQLEQTRLDNAKTNFDLTGTGSSAYIQQQAYMNSKSASLASSGYHDAMNAYKSGQAGQAGYGLQTSYFSPNAWGSNSAKTIVDYMNNNLGISAQQYYRPDGNIGIRTTSNDMTSSQAQSVSNTLHSKFGMLTSAYPQSGSMGFATHLFGNNNFGYVSAQKIASDVSQAFGVNAIATHPDANHIGVASADQNLSADTVAQIEQYIHDKYKVYTDPTGASGQKMGFKTSLFSNNTFGYVSAQTIAQNVSKTFGIDAIATHPDKNHFGVASASQNMSASMVNQINAYINSKFKVHSQGTGTDTGNKMDLNQQIANLQVIADAYNKMTDQLNTYKQAVTDGFKAGAIGIDEYISKLNQLRDKQTETKENAINMISSMQGGFQSALSDALTKGMQGSINSPIDFMNSIKSTISSSVSGQLSQTLLQNTGLQDVMNKITSSITKASTSGDPNSIANMFNNNDFGKQIQDAIAPFLPMIQQIVGSTKGIFTILNNQTFNATSGFKIDNYMNEIASKQTYQGLKTWNNSMTNDVGSPIVKAGSGGQITTTAPSQTPTGLPTTTTIPVNGTTTQTGAPPNTIGGGTGAPSTTSYTNGSNNGKSFPSAPKPAPKPTVSTSKTSSARTYVVKAGDNPWTIETKLGLPHGWITTHNSINPNNLQIGQVLKYHTGGIAGVMNFQSAERLQANEVSAILQKGEATFQPKQIGDLFSNAFNAGQQSNSGGGANINITVNVQGGNASDKQSIEQTVKLAVSQALSEFKKQTRLGNLSSRGTSY